MSTPAPVRYVSIAIERSPSDVHDFVVGPSNLPRWAKGLSGGIAQVDGEWISESPMGRATVCFASKNPYGVLESVGQATHVGPDTAPPCPSPTLPP